MYRQNATVATTINRNKSYVAETLVEKVRRVTQNGEPIEDTAQTIYEERGEKVNPAYDIRTDWRELALEATDVVTANKLAKRTANMEAIKGGKDETSGQSTDGTASGETK